MTSENTMAQIELEYKILSSFLLCDDGSRDRIAQLDSGMFSDVNTKGVFDIFKGEYSKHPKADYMAYVLLLNADQRKNIISSLESSISPDIAQSRLDDTLSAFRSAYVQRVLSTAAAEISLKSDIGISDIHSLIHKAENLTRKRNDPAAEYLTNYSKAYDFIPTGFPQLDSILNGGFIKGTLATVGARPSTGKTTFALNIASHNADKKILFFSLEMTSRMIYDRLISDCANVNYSLAGLHKIPVETAKGVLNAYKKLDLIDDVAYIEDINEIILCEKPDLVIIDFMQIITSKRNFTDNRQRIDYISGTLKFTAKRINCCILALSQITRAGKEKPTMSDLKESGGLEQDSDYVILLHRPYINDKTDNSIDEKQTSVILDKNKFGSTKELSYSFEGCYQRFTEIPDKTNITAHLKPQTTESITSSDDLPF